MKTLLTIIAISVLGYSSVASAHTTSNKKETIVLVHGAWSDASAWNAVTPLLQDKGHEVIVVNLAGHGTDTTSFARISLQTYVEQVKTAIGKRSNVILVGHSFAGIIISQVAEEIPTQIKKLIYLAAALPHNGDDLLSMAKQDPLSHVGNYLTLDQAHGAALIAKEGVVDVFAADAPKNVQEYIASHIQPEPLAPLVTPVRLTEKNFGSITKVYIYTQYDNTISYPAQQHMVKGANVTKTYLLESSHTPFISMPYRLADIINTETK